MALHQSDDLAFFADLAALAEADAFAAWLTPLRKCDWVVYAKPPFGGPEAVLVYLSRYTHRVAISNSRLISVDAETVSFRWKDHRIKTGDRHKVMRLATDEFIRRFLIHALPGALRALRGVDLIAAVTFATVGDAGRFESPRQLMGYLGLVPGERSTGETTKRIGITKAGNSRVRTLLVECAWTYRYPPRIGKRKLYRLEEVSSSVREIAWKAQTRLTARYRMLSARGKKSTVVCTAVARELAGFMWAIARRRDRPRHNGSRARLAHWRRQDNGRGMSVNRFVAGMSDARSKTGTAPDAKSGMW